MSRELNFKVISFLRKYTHAKTNLSCYNSDIHESILIIFGTNVNDKVGNHKVLHFPTSPN